MRYKTLYRKNKGFDPRNPVKVAKDLYDLDNQAYMYDIIGNTPAAPLNNAQLGGFFIMQYKKPPLTYKKQVELLRS